MGRERGEIKSVVRRTGEKSYSDNFLARKRCNRCVKLGRERDVQGWTAFLTGKRTSVLRAVTDMVIIVNQSCIRFERIQLPSGVR